MMMIKETIRRIVIGSLAGAFIGLLELWFYEFNLRHGIAAILSGAIFGSILGLFGSMLRNTTKALILCGSSGGLASAIWWAIARPDVSILRSVIIGLALGLLFVWSETDQKSKTSIWPPR